MYLHKLRLQSLLSFIRNSLLSYVNRAILDAKMVICNMSAIEKNRQSNRFKTPTYECHMKCAPSSHDPSVNTSGYEKCTMIYEWFLLFATFNFWWLQDSK